MNHRRLPSPDAEADLCNPSVPNPAASAGQHILTKLLMCYILLLILGCSAPESDSAETDPAEAASGEAPSESASPDTSESPETNPVGSMDSADDETLVIFLGDSLTAGYGLDVEQSFPSLLAAELEAEGRAVRLVNAGISGDTTAGGLRRLDWLLGQEPDVLVVGLGGNDGLRGVDLADSEENLRQIVTRGRDAGAAVLLAGMLIPPNYGPDYTERFAAIYPRLAEELGVALIPFLLEGVAADPALNLADGIHPNAEGQKIVAQTVRRHLEPLLEE